MENSPKKQDMKIELTPEVAAGNYSNLVMVVHSPAEFFLDFISVSPNVPQARVLSRIIMTPENAKQLLFALRENVERYENTFGVIERRMPKGGNNTPDLNNPFKA